MSYFYDPATGIQGGFYSDDAAAPAGMVAAPVPPIDGRQLWVDGAWVSPPPTLLPISPRQIRLALNAAGLLDQTEQAIAAGTAQNKIEWQYATQFERGHALIAAMAAALSLSSEQVDAMWLGAMAL